MLNVAIIGTGNISPSHIESYLAFPHMCTITHLVDIYPEKAEAKAKEFSLDVEIYDSHKAILDNDDIDLVSICTPPYTHAEIAIDFLKSGKDVILEKPMASSLEECDAILKAAHSNKRLLSVIAQNRFRTPIMNLKKILEQGLIGQVLHAQIDSLWWRGHCYYDLWWRGSWKHEGGGCTLNHAVHHIDMLLWMLGLPEEVMAVLGNVAHDNAEVEDISIAILKYSNNALAQITSSVVHHGEEQQIIFQGEKARVSAPWKVYASTSMDNGFPKKNEVLEREINQYYNNLPDLEYEGHQGQIQNVLTAIQNGTQPLIQGKDGRNTIELITAIYKAGSTGELVKLPIGKDDPFYTVDGILESAKYFYEKKKHIANLSNEDITLGSDYQNK